MERLRSLLERAHRSSVARRSGGAAPRATLRSATRSRGAVVQSLTPRREDQFGVAGRAPPGLGYAAPMKALVLRQLTKTYKNGIKALKAIDLEVDEGDFFALLGPNGAGKTTAIGIVTSLVNKTSGVVEVFRARHRSGARSGEVLHRSGAAEIISTCSRPVSPSSSTRPASTEYRGRWRSNVRRNISSNCNWWSARNSIARSLSGGMKRRLMIARALMHEPKLLILDEPTAGVDIENRRSMWEFLRNINDAGTTIILTTHYLEEAENLCRNVAIIEGGNIIERDSMVNVLRKLPNRSVRVQPARRAHGGAAIVGIHRGVIRCAHAGNRNGEDTESQ